VDDKRNLVIFAILAALVLYGGKFLSDHYFPTANPPSTQMVDGKSVPLPSPTVAAPAAGPAAPARPLRGVERARRFSSFKLR